MGNGGPGRQVVAATHWLVAVIGVSVCGGLWLGESAGRVDPNIFFGTSCPFRHLILVPKHILRSHLYVLLDHGLKQASTSQGSMMMVGVISNQCPAKR